MAGLCHPTIVADLHPGDVGTITRIANDQYVFLDDERGGFRWQCFQRIAELLAAFKACSNHMQKHVLKQAQFDDMATDQPVFRQRRPQVGLHRLLSA